MMACGLVPKKFLNLIFIKFVFNLIKIDSKNHPVLDFGQGG